MVQAKLKSKARGRQISESAEEASRIRLLSSLLQHIDTNRKTYLLRRPHRSFRYTRRRDYERSLRMPGYVAFTIQVFRQLWEQKRLFGSVVLLYGVLAGLLVGLSSQDTYTQLSDVVAKTGSSLFTGGVGSIGQAGLLVLSSINGGFSPNLSESQQLYSVIVFLLTWLTTIWLLRTVQTGRVPKLRDGVYNAGAPIVPTGIIFVLAVLQLFPAAIAVTAVTAAINTNLFANGFIAMIVTIIAALLVIVSVYWVTSTLIALVIVTLPGMYPWQALKAAGDLVIGRRLRILYRIVWLSVCNAVMWIGVVLPAIVLERFIRSFASWVGAVPVIPVIVVCMSGFIVVWSSTYIYLLYRKVVADDAQPA